MNQRLFLSLALPTFGLISPSFAGPFDQMTVAEPPAATSKTVFGNTIFEYLKAKKDESGIPISLGAWHWWRLGDEGPGSNGYGIPGLRGTYYWTIDVDPHIDINGSTFEEIGLHTQVRLREQGKFRPFIDNDVWTWEAYAYADTTYGKFKAGQIWKRFGLDWDGVFFGNVAYFDGFKLDADLGVSWEETFEIDDSFKIDTIAQFFVREDGINGSLVGSDAESTNTFREENTAVLRVVPTWTLDDGATVAFGLGGSVGEIDAAGPVFPDDTFAAWVVDLTYTKDRFKVFGEVLQSHGTIHPTRYVSGGPGDRITDYLVGTSYQTGPVTWRANYSAGLDDHPGGEQSLFLPGATIALTPNVDLYAEYVYWVVEPDGGPEGIYEDGFQLIVNWRF